MLTDNSLRGLLSTPFLFFIILIALIANNIGYPVMCLAMDDEFQLPVPGVMVNPGLLFNPPVLKGIKIHPDNPFKFEFILDQGDSKYLSFPNTFRRLDQHSQLFVGDPQQEQLKNDSTRLIKYFLASLTIPEKDLWVNLSPYEKNRIVPESFGQTEMGRDLLAEDYMLKQITASLMYPEGATGQRFWKRIYEESAKRFGTTNIPVNTFNKVWIVPDKAVVYENAQAGTAYIVESKLKVMLEQDYLALSKNASLRGAEGDAATFERITHSVEIATSLKNTPRNDTKRSTNEDIGPFDDISMLGFQVVREVVIPELTKEVNEDKNFSQLRQIYNSLILAAWYKKKIKDSILAVVYEDKNKIKGLIPSPLRVWSGRGSDVEQIYHYYLQTFKKGAYNYIKEEKTPYCANANSGCPAIARKYFSGGFEARGIDAAMTTSPRLGRFFEFSKRVMLISLDLLSLPKSALPVADNNGSLEEARIMRDLLKRIQSEKLIQIRDFFLPLEGKGFFDQDTLWQSSEKSVAEKVFYEIIKLKNTSLRNELFDSIDIFFNSPRLVKLYAMHRFIWKYDELLGLRMLIKTINHLREYDDYWDRHDYSPGFSVDEDSSYAHITVDTLYLTGQLDAARQSFSEKGQSMRQWIEDRIQNKDTTKTDRWNLLKVMFYLIIFDPTYARTHFNSSIIKQALLDDKDYILAEYTRSNINDLWYETFLKEWIAKPDWNFKGLEKIQNPAITMFWRFQDSNGFKALRYAQKKLSGAFSNFKGHYFILNQKLIAETIAVPISDTDVRVGEIVRIKTRFNGDIYCVVADKVATKDVIFQFMGVGIDGVNELMYNGSFSTITLLTREHSRVVSIERLVPKPGFMRQLDMGMTSITRGVGTLQSSPNLQADTASPNLNKGGIDLSSDKALSIQNNGQSVKFHIDAAQLKALEDASGFEPVIIDMQPMLNVRLWLGFTP